MKKLRTQIGRSNDIQLHRRVSRDHSSVTPAPTPQTYRSPTKRHASLSGKLPEVSRNEPSKRELYEVMELGPTANKLGVIAMRRALRKKYAHRSDRRKVFDKWDLCRQGVVRAQDLQAVLRRLGQETSVEDVKDLIFCVTKNRSGILTYANMCALLETKNDQLGFDSYLMSHFIQHPAKLAKDYNDRLERTQSLLKCHLNLQLDRLRTLFQQQDTAGTGRVNFPQFLQAMNAVRIPYATVTGLNLKILYHDMGADKYGLDYGKMLEYIEKCRPFNLNLGQKIDTPNYVQKPVKVIHLLRQVSRGKEELLQELIEHYGRWVSRQKLRNFVVSKGKTVKTDIECFLESLHWNRRGETTPQHIVEAVFRTKPVLPPIHRELNFSVDEVVKRSQPTEESMA